MKRLRDTLEGSGRTALDMSIPASGPVASFRQSIAGRFSYGIVG
jgi:hypothetical protein